MIADFAYTLGRRLRWRGFDPRHRPNDEREQAVLDNRDEWQRARAESRGLGLPLHPDPPRAWDSALALSAVLRYTCPDDRIVDAGGEIHSVILPALSLYGYRDLWAINSVFDRRRRRDSIRYEPGDATRTDWRDRSVDAITCLGVLEHGFAAEALLREAARLLRPGGVLVISTDYWPEKIVHGTPIRIADRSELQAWTVRASAHGLIATEPATAALACTPATPAIYRRRFGVGYTFALLTFRRC